MFKRNKVVEPRSYAEVSLKFTMPQCKERIRLVLYSHDKPHMCVKNTTNIVHGINPWYFGYIEDVLPRVRANYREALAEGSFTIQTLRSCGDSHVLAVQLVRALETIKNELREKLTFADIVATINENRLALIGVEHATNSGTTE